MVYVTVDQTDPYLGHVWCSLLEHLWCHVCLQPHALAFRWQKLVIFLLLYISSLGS